MCERPQNPAGQHAQFSGDKSPSPSFAPVGGPDRRRPPTGQPHPAPIQTPVSQLLDKNSALGVVHKLKSESASAPFPDCKSTVCFLDKSQVQVEASSHVTRLDLHDNTSGKLGETAVMPPTNFTLMLQKSILCLGTAGKN